jgi:hypothetical protein
MDVAELEALILDGLGRTARALQLAGPAHDLCLPGMVDDNMRRKMFDARHDLLKAALQADSARAFFIQAAGMLGDFLNPKEAA